MIPPFGCSLISVCVIRVYTKGSSPVFRIWGARRIVRQRAYFYCVIKKQYLGRMEILTAMNIVTAQNDMSQIVDADKKTCLAPFGAAQAV